MDYSNRNQFDRTDNSNQDWNERRDSQQNEGGYNQNRNSYNSNNGNRNQDNDSNRNRNYEGGSGNNWRNDNDDNRGGNQWNADYGNRRQYGNRGSNDNSQNRGNYGSSGGYNRNSGWQNQGNGNDNDRNREEDRNWWNKTTDEVSSWFGDSDADRRRRMDKEADGKHKGRGPKGYRRSDDRIKEDVNDRLSDDSHVDASEIDVTVSEGEVTLTGTVESRDEKRRAEDVAEAVSGVNHVQNNLRLNKNLNAGQGNSTNTGAGNASAGGTGSMAGQNTSSASGGTTSNMGSSVANTNGHKSKVH